MNYSLTQRIKKQWGRAPWIVGFTRFYDSVQTLLLFLVLVFTVPAYFMAGMTWQKALLLFGIQLLVLGFISLNIWFIWAYTYRIRKAWYAHIICTGIEAIWITVSYFWLHESLLRSDALMTYVDLINLLLWFLPETRAWFKLDAQQGELSVPARQCLEDEDGCGV